jgi:hypothetical protein
MPLAEDIIGGLANAAGSTSVAGEVASRKENRRATQLEQLHAQTQMTLDEVHRLHDEKAKLHPGTDDQAIQAIDKRLGELQQHFTDLYHPEKNPGALQHLGGFLKQHLSRRKQPQVPTTPAQAKAQFSWAGTPAGTVSVEDEGWKTAPGAKPYQGKDGLWYETQINKKGEFRARALPEGFTPPAPHYSDYAQGLRRFVEAEGGDPDNPTAAEEEAYRNQRLKDATAARATDTTRTSTTTDPFGVSSTTTSKMHRGPAGEATPSTTTPAPVKTAGEAKKRMAAAAPASAKQLDAQGHIPETAHVNPRLREAANQILDGMDMNKLPVPARDREAAAELARQYGWKGQGMFAPKDMMMMRESTSILKQLAASPSLSVFDDFGSRQKIAQVIQNPDKRGFIGQSVQSLAAANLTPQEQEFVTLYNQAVGRIAGLSQLVRSGRATEATIERLKTELPHPFNTTNSAHARQKLAQIQNEIDIALQKGQFTDAPGTGISDDEFLKNF